MKKIRKMMVVVVFLMTLGTDCVVTQEVRNVYMASVLSVWCVEMCSLDSAVFCQNVTVQEMDAETTTASFYEPDVWTYTDYQVPDYSGFKSFMPYLKNGDSIFKKDTKQDKLQKMAELGEYGTRKVDGRYCAALGSYFTEEIGQYFDLILENGTVIPCILGDAKDDRDTDKMHIFTVESDCCSEFIVRIARLPANVRVKGDMSYCCEEWNSKVVTIRIYDKNIFTENGQK